MGPLVLPNITQVTFLIKNKNFIIINRHCKACDRKSINNLRSWEEVKGTYMAHKLTKSCHGPLKKNAVSYHKMLHNTINQNGAAVRLAKIINHFLRSKSERLYVSEMLTREKACVRCISLNATNSTTCLKLREK